MKKITNEELSITHFFKLISGSVIEFVRVGGNFGWYTKIKGERYGDYITSSEDVPILDIWDILENQASETIKKNEN